MARNRDMIKECLFGNTNEHVYAILDGASVTGLLARLENLEVEYFCLLRQELEPEEKEAAPYVFSLQEDSEVTDWILENWGSRWGVFAVSEASLRECRDHLRSLVIVGHEDQTYTYFRFYDPRILQVFLPSCDPDQLREVFGPIRLFIMEHSSGDSVLSCGCSEMGLQSSVTSVAGALPGRRTVL